MIARGLAKETNIDIPIVLIGTSARRSVADVTPRQKSDSFIRVFASGFSTAALRNSRVVGKVTKYPSKRSGTLG